MQAILDVFSGRPNPSWDLTAEESSELARRLIGLVATNRTLTEGNLGYRGLTILNPDKMAGLPVEIRVFHGVISLWENGHPTYYHDRNNVEDWLIELARKLGHGAILDQLIGNDV